MKTHTQPNKSYSWNVKFAPEDQRGVPLLHHLKEPGALEPGLFVFLMDMTVYWDLHNRYVVHSAGFSFWVRLQLWGSRGQLRSEPLRATWIAPEIRHGTGHHSFRL